MYCKYCGKFIATNADLCDDCARAASMNGGAQQNQSNQQNTYQGNYQNNYQNNYQGAYQNNYQPPYQNNYQYTNFRPRTYIQDSSAINLGKAIAATILGTVGFFMMYFGCIFALTYIFASVGIVLLILGAVPTVMGLVFGINSISNFKETSHIKSGKRIPVLILGINAVFMSAMGILLFLLFMGLASLF